MISSKLAVRRTSARLLDWGAIYREKLEMKCYDADLANKEFENTSAYVERATIQRSERLLSATEIALYFSRRERGSANTIPNTQKGCSIHIRVGCNDLFRNTVF